MGKVDKKGCVLCFAASIIVGMMTFTGSVVAVLKVTTNGLFEPFLHENEHFTKTGSGQT
jgi:NAD/NADP transhydrogenase beta subunit